MEVAPEDRTIADRLMQAFLRLAPLEAKVAELEARLAERDMRIARLEAENARLRKALDDSRRAGRRQAAPFSKGDPEADPKTPGRKPGDKYGVHRRRDVPDEADIERTVDAVPPDRCTEPGCEGRLIEYRVADQYQVDIPPIRPTTTRFRVHVGICDCCGKRVQGRHAEQTSDALGACSVQIGPQALSFAAYLNKTCGMSWGRIADVFHERFGLDVGRSTLCRATVERLAERLRPTFEDLVDRLHEAAVVHADETGWKVSGLKRWLWVFVTEHVAVYVIRGGKGARGSGVLEDILGLDWCGILVRDGWKSYRKLIHALHQTCLAHLLRRCSELLETAVGSAREFPQQIKSLLKDALSLRKRIADISERGLSIATGRLDARCGRLLADPQSDAGNERFRKHLANERKYLFTFLEFWRLNVEPTNNTSERALRGPAVVNRKMSGGNRSDAGAAAQSIFTTFVQSCLKQGRNAIGLMAEALRTVGNVVFPLANGPPQPAAD